MFLPRQNIWYVSNRNDGDGQHSLMDHPDATVEFTIAARVRLKHCIVWYLKFDNPRLIGIRSNYV